MNTINVVNNMIIPFIDNNVIINGNSVDFLGNGDYFIEYIECDNVEIEFNIKSNVCIQLFEFSGNKDLSINVKYSLNDNSSIIVNKFYGNRNTDETVNIYLKGSKANIKYNFSSISSNADNYLINIYHLDNRTKSDIFNRTVAKEGSSNFFDINSYVENGIYDCYLNQSTKIATLGESNNRINPNMFISENSTTAIHSSVIGSISGDDLFYLMSRGITYDDAINLIIKGMLLSNLNNNMEIREKILKILENREVNR